MKFWLGCALALAPMGATAQELSQGSPLDTPSGMMVAICAGTIGAYADQRLQVNVEEGINASFLALQLMDLADKLGDSNYPDGLQPMVEEAKAEAFAASNLGEDTPDLTGADQATLSAHQSLANCNILVDHLRKAGTLPPLPAQ